MPAMPAFAILMGTFLKELVSRKGILVILSIGLAFSAAHVLLYYPTVSHPMNEAALWTLERTSEGDGIITSEYGQQFYFMKYDMNISRYLFLTIPADEKPFERLLAQEYTDPVNEALGIRNPEFKYVIVKEPMDRLLNSPVYFIYEILALEDNTYREIEQRPDVFELAETLEGQDGYNMKIYRINQGAYQTLF